MEQNAVMRETSGQLGADSHGKEERVDGDKAFKMRDGAVCGDIAEINKPCVELLGEASERAVPIATAENGTSAYAEPEEEYTVEEDDDVSYVESDENSLADDSSYQAVDGYYSHKFLQDLLARMATEPHPLSNEAQEAKREPLDPALVETYTAHATRVYESYLRHIDALGVTFSKKVQEIHDKALGLDLARRIQVQLYCDTVEAAVSHLRRVAMTWGSLVLLDIAEPSRTVPRGTSEQYLFCRIVSACLKLRDTWWRSEFFLAKYFLRFFNRCQFERRQLSYDSSELETEVRGTWAAYLESVHEQCASIGANRALYSMSLHQGEDAEARIGDGARFYMDMVTPLHKAVTLEWSKTYSVLIEQLARTAQAEPDRKADLDQVAAWVEETGRQVSDAMQTAFAAFENQVRVITKNVELFSAQIRKILE
ncbi:uncharacterized protein LOC142804275 isoform X2 [Rhipicephalus microplus]|uniref:uncharacterized protein LOC142804275 isoform X2 n=1 Tax=Rhipicephalus microplus TaxID=6941 RepID=UPI003F6CDEA3